MKERSKCSGLIVSILVLAIFSASGYQINLVYSQDEETPDFGGQKAPFTPLPEEDRDAPPPPSNATVVRDLPKSLFVRDNDTDTEPLAITNKTEMLEILPANATSAIAFVDKSLKNSTGQGLLPPEVLKDINASAKQGNASALGQNQNTSTILDIMDKENLTQKILPIISPSNKSATSSDLEEIEETQPGGASSNATAQEEQAGNKTTAVPGLENKTTSELNETGTQQNTREENGQSLSNQSEDLPRPTENLESKQALNETQIGENPPVNLTNNTLNEDNPPVSQSESSEDNPPVSQSDRSNDNNNDGNDNGNEDE